MFGTACTKSPSLSGHRAIGYVRRSTDRQEQSIPDQKHAIEQYAAEHGCGIDRYYVDDAISGTSSLGRRAFQELIADAQKPSRPFDTVIVYDVKRFGRVDNDEAGYYRHMLRMHGVKVRYVSENFTGGGTDDLLRPVKQWQARQESKDLSKVTIRGLLSKAETGFWMGGAPPLGYDLRYQSSTDEFLFRLQYHRDGTKEMFDERGHSIRILPKGERIAVSRKDRARLTLSAPERVKLIQRIFAMYTEEGKGLKAIANELNQSSMPSARSKAWANHYSGRWALTTIRSILVNPAYAGDMAWNRHTDARFYKIMHGVAVEREDGYGRRLTCNDETHWIVVRDAHEALITRRQWTLAQQTLRDKPASSSQRGVNPRTGGTAGQRRPEGGGAGPRAKFLLSGLITCSKCGSRYEGYTQRSHQKDVAGNRRKALQYACGGYIRNGRSVCQIGEVGRDELERLVISAVISHYEKYTGAKGKKEVARLVQEELGSETTRGQHSLAASNKRISELTVKINNLLDNITATNRDAVDRRLRELIREKEEVQLMADALARNSMSERQLRSMIDDVFRFSESVTGVLTGGSIHDKQTVLRSCLHSISLSHAAGRIELAFRRLPSNFAGSCAGRSEHFVLPNF